MLQNRNISTNKSIYKMDISTHKLQVVVSERYFKVIASKALYYIGCKMIIDFRK